MQKTAVFPGSFDPFTVGHEDIVLRALDLFDFIIVAIGVHSMKKPLMKIESRLKMINKVFEAHEQVTVDAFEGLTVDYCKKVSATHMLRGIRTAADFEYERAIGQINRKMLPTVETVFMLTSPQHTPVNSTIIREIIRNRGDVAQFIPAGIIINDYL